MLRSEKIDRTKAEIVDKSREIFQQSGYKHTSVDDISKITGRSKGTIYKYFLNKSEIFDAIIDSELSLLRKSITLKLSKIPSIKLKIPAYIVLLFDGLSQKMILYRLVRSDIHDMGEGERHYKKIINYESEFLLSLLYTGFENGEFKNISYEDIPVFADILISAFFGVLSYEMEHDDLRNRIIKLFNTLIPQLFR